MMQTQKHLKKLIVLPNLTRKMKTVIINANTAMRFNAESIGIILVVKTHKKTQTNKAGVKTANQQRKIVVETAGHQRKIAETKKNIT